jgi:hypothetical protein
MKTTDNKIKLIIFPFVLLLILIPHYLYYQYDWVKYIYLIGVPLISIKQEFDKYKIQKSISFIDVATYLILSITIALCYMDDTFTQIFVWQISLAVLGILIGLLFDIELYRNKYLRLWSRLMFFGVFIYFVSMNIDLID